MSINKSGNSPNSKLLPGSLVSLASRLFQGTSSIPKRKGIGKEKKKKEKENQKKKKREN